MLRAGFMILLAVSAFSCRKMPKIDICFSDPEAGGLTCVLSGGEDRFVPYSDTTNYFCTPSDHAEKLLQYCTRRSE